LHIMNNRERIFKAADRLFGEVGFDGASTSKIAEISNTNKALIHYHFKTKEGLFQAVLECYFQNLSETLQEALLQEGPIRGRLGHLINAYIDFLEHNKNYLRIVQREIMGGKNKGRIINHMIPIFEIIMDVIRETFPRTRSGDLSVEQLMISFYGMIITYFTCSDVLQHLLKTDPMSKKNIRDRKKHLRTMVDMVLDTLQED